MSYLVAMTRIPFPEVMARTDFMAKQVRIRSTAMPELTHSRAVMMLTSYTAMPVRTQSLEMMVTIGFMAARMPI